MRTRHPIVLAAALLLLSLVGCPDCGAPMRSRDRRETCPACAVARFSSAVRMTDGGAP